MDNLFRGELVRLAAVDPQPVAEAYNCWSRDSEYWRLMFSDPAYPRSVKAVKDQLEKDLGKVPTRDYFFNIRTLQDDRLIGDAGLDGVDWRNGDAYVGIGLGNHQDWGKGYGTDAMRLILRFAFDELNLHRLSLTVFEYNVRTIRSYQKASFIVEGRTRGFVNRDGRRWDMICMGILRHQA
jgi:RimJ/RimL family protein N-acetyltransferase